MKRSMRPQNNEPCIKCKLWSNNTGCEHYDSSAMQIFGACGHKQPKDKASSNNKPKITKKEVLTNKAVWKIENLFYQGQSKWFVRAINKETQEIIEFTTTTSYMKKATQTNQLCSLTQ